MDAEMQEQLDRVDLALTALLDSMTAFNPSVPAADALLEADDALFRSTQRLAEHQEAVKRVKGLRTDVEALDEKIKSNITALDDTRTELLRKTPVTLPDSDARKVDSQDLLNYSQRIAKFTVPPTNRPELPPALVHNQPTDVPADGTETEIQDSPDASKGMSKGTTSAFESLDDAYKNAIKPEREPSATFFVNWPLQSNLTSGALYAIQKALDDGLDPATLDLARGGVPIQPKQAVTAQLGQAASKAAEMGSRPPPPPPAVAAAAARPPPKKTADDDFGGDFDLYDPDE